MTEIQIPIPTQLDVYSYGFDKTLNRYSYVLASNPIDSPLVYNAIDGSVQPQSIYFSSATKSGSQISATSLGTASPGFINIQTTAFNNTTVNLTNTTSETVLRTLTLTGKRVGLNGSIIIKCMWRAELTGGGAGTITLKIKFGNQVISHSRSNIAGVSGQFSVVEIVSNNATNSQTLTDTHFANDGASSSLKQVAQSTSSINTDGDITITITGTLTNTAHNIWLDSVTVDVIPRN